MPDVILLYLKLIFYGIGKKLTYAGAQYAKGCHPLSSILYFAGYLIKSGSLRTVTTFHYHTAIFFVKGDPVA